MANPSIQKHGDDADMALVEALRAGDESAYSALLDKYEKPLLRLAKLYVRDERLAEEVLQETWLAIFQGLDRFEARSSFKTWLFSILVNRAKSRAEREDRYIPFSDLEREQESGPTVDPSRFNDPEYPKHWSQIPASWDEIPETRMLSLEVGTIIRQAIDHLRPGQRAVITLRDVDGLSAEEVCNILNISETNQRALLHRARAFVRRALEDYLEVGS